MVAGFVLASSASAPTAKLGVPSLIGRHMGLALSPLVDCQTPPYAVPAYTVLPVGSLTRSTASAVTRPETRTKPISFCGLGPSSVQLPLVEIGGGSVVAVPRVAENIRGTGTAASGTRRRCASASRRCAAMGRP